MKFRRNLLDARSKLYKNLKQMKATLDFLKLPPHAILTNGDVALKFAKVYIITIQRHFVPVGAISFNNSEAHF